MTPICTSLARTIRNATSYDDWHYGTEPIPGDSSWVKPRTLAQLHRRVSDSLAAADTVNPDRLAAVALTEILSLSPETLVELQKQDPDLLF